MSSGRASALGLAAAIVVLLIAFGSFIAMGLPVVTALLGLGTGFGAIALASQVIDMPDFSTALAAMIGLGVGIDYSLFILTCFRPARGVSLGYDPHASAPFVQPWGRTGRDSPPVCGQTVVKARRARAGVDRLRCRGWLHGPPCAPPRRHQHAPALHQLRPTEHASAALVVGFAGRLGCGPR